MDVKAIEMKLRIGLCGDGSAKNKISTEKMLLQSNVYQKTQKQVLMSLIHFYLGV